MQECVAHWEQEGLAVSHDQMAAHVRLTMPFQSFIDPLDETFQAPGGMPERIGAWCGKTGQVVPRTHGEIATCIFESLAMIYCETLQALESMLGYRIPVIHLVGGGANNQLLCQFAANAMNRTVVAGPAEATAIGNILQQAIATGSVKDFAEARSIVARSFPVRTYEPFDADEWAVAHQRYLRVVGRCVRAG